MKRLSKNLISLFSADILRRLMGFVSVAYLARILGKEGFGVVNLGFAVLAYSMVLGAAGFPILGTKLVAQGKSQEFVGKIICNRLIMSVFILIVVCTVILLVIPDLTLAYLIILFSFCIIPQALYLDWFFQGKETMGIVSGARILESAIYLIVILIFVRTAQDVLWVAVGAIMGNFITAIILYARFRSIYSGVHLDMKPSMKLLKQSMPLAIGVILATLVGNYPPIALGVFNTTSDVGIFSAANKFVFSLMVGDRILLLLLVPASARKYTQAPQAFKEMLNEAVKWILILGLPIAVGGTLIADDLTILVFGIEYIESAVVLKVLIWYFLLTMLHTIFTSGLIGAGGEKSYGNTMIITALIYLFCVSIGAYWFGPLGAAFGVVVAEGVGVLLINRALRLIVTLRQPEDIIRIILSVIIMALGVAFVLQYGLIWALLVGVISYSILIWIVRAVSWNDLKSLSAKF
jgi:O-antigen/teichoic acid export membrane protein